MSTQVEQAGEQEQHAEFTNINHVLMNQRLIIFSNEANPRVEKAHRLLQMEGIPFFELQFHFERRKKHKAMYEYLRNLHPSIKKDVFPLIFVGKWYVGSVEELEESIKNRELHTLMLKPIVDLHTDEINLTETFRKMEQGIKDKPHPIVSPESSPQETVQEKPESKNVPGQEPVQFEGKKDAEKERSPEVREESKGNKLEESIESSGIGESSEIRKEGNKSEQECQSKHQEEVTGPVTGEEVKPTTQSEGPPKTDVTSGQVTSEMEDDRDIKKHGPSVTPEESHPGVRTQ